MVFFFPICACPVLLLTLALFVLISAPMNIVDFFAIIPYYIEMPLMVNAYLIDPTGGSSNGGGIGDLRVIRFVDA